MKIELTDTERINLIGMLEGILELGRDVVSGREVVICYEPILQKQLLKKLKEEKECLKIF